MPNENNAANCLAYLADRTPTQKWLIAERFIHRGWIDREMLTAVLPPRPSDEELAAEEARQAAELAQRRPTPTEGPGTELTAILASLGITAAVGCDCKEKAAQMNRWGVDGCRKHFWEIVGWLKDGQGRWGWTDYLRAAVLAVITGLAFQLDPTDPFPGILTEAIRRAEAKAAG